MTEHDSNMAKSQFGQTGLLLFSQKRVRASKKPKHEADVHEVV